MEAKDDFEVDNLTTPTITATGTSFSQLLFGDDDDHQHALAFASAAVDHYNNNNNLNINSTHNLPLFSIDKPPKMLSFGDFHDVAAEHAQLFLPENNSTPQKSVSVITSSDSSSASSCNHTTTVINSISKTNRKRNGPGLQPIVKVPNKKNKAENQSSTSTGHAKRKEKLGERIAALQQLVSPFGKTDTASVLHEAMGYIRFLHDQVQVLCSPYLQRLPSSSSSSSSFHQHQRGEENGNEDVKEEDKRDLKSMGLCLIPLQCTLHVSSTNGADFWSPAGAANNVTPYAQHHLSK